ncbi:MAG TPA: toll/interleukin-1 receptor domain-containing protein [Anaerolineales bacterium]|nr:toll/interleukin-1 receptor domain-containing protein [Anaerolineales bacterium]
MPTERKLRIFLCHASQDKPVVRDLYKRLTAEDWIDPWLDEERLLPGQDWNLEIEKAVESSDAVIVCVSSTSVAKEGYVQKELRKVLDLALEKLEGAIFVLPVKLDDCDLPRQLRDRQALNYFPEANRTAAYDRLKASLNIRKDHLGI